ncbi:MAG: hypothetical protein ABI440_06895, partial [Casimicrobiaceae bacterium]
MKKKQLWINTLIKNYAILRSILTIIILTGLLGQQNSYAQSTMPDSTKSMEPANQLKAKTTYPKVVGYLSFILPLVTVTSNSTTYNFNGAATSIGFPVGVNVLYSDKFGFSYEFTPTIKASNATKTAPANSKTSNLLFDPGPMFRFDHGFTIITRLAFETSGRYGFTPVFNKV